MNPSLSRNTRPPLERMYRIHGELSRGALINCTILTKALEVSRKTIVRDIGFMRDRLGLPIAYEQKTESYYYTETVSAFPTVTVTEGELLALLVAQRALEQYRGTPFHEQLAVAFEKLTSGLKDRVTFSSADELQSVSFKNSGLGRSDLVTFNALSRAVINQQELTFGYRKPGEDKTVVRRVQPYHLANRENLWYLIAFDTERKALRTFAVPRITQSEVQKETFVRPAEFSPEKFFATALGVLGGEGNFLVVIRFKSSAADRVREREWHESQELIDLPAGQLELRLRLGALAEVESWVLSWGVDAEVIQPPELRERLEAAISALIKLYR